MHRFTSRIRRPVKRQGAEQYILLTLLSFAASVILTRLFLELTGYPQLGGGTFHIAHVLWGGLLLFAAALMPLFIANRWVYTLGALLAGAGVGLFIDEVGKFITQNNDYFFPLAAPIIYAFFLLTVLLYLRVRRPPSRSGRAELYRAFDAMEEVLEHDLDPQERQELEERLRYVRDHSDHPDLALLAGHLLDFLTVESLSLAEPQPSFINRLENRWQAFQKRWLTRRRTRVFLASGLLGMSFLAMANMLQALPYGPFAGSLPHLIEELYLQGLVQSTFGLNWFLARIALETSVGLILLAASILLIAGKDRLGCGLSYIGLLLSLTTVNLLVFYFDQFSTILIASVQFVFFLATAYYRQTFLQDSAL